MRIPDEYHKLMISELKEINKLCNTTESPDDKLYFFSAAFGVINRIMNFYYDPTLVFIHQVLQEVHKKVTQRLQSGPYKFIYNSMPQEILDTLFQYFMELTDAIEKQDVPLIWEILERFSNISYSLTGNGFYLYIRERLKLKTDEKKIPKT